MGLFFYLHRYFVLNVFLHSIQNGEILILNHRPVFHATGASTNGALR